MNRAALRRASSYLLAAGLALLAWSAWTWVEAHLQAGFAPFLVAAILAARFGGLGPGLVVPTLCAALLMPQVLSPPPGARPLAGRLVSSQTIAMLAVWLISALGVARRRAEDSAQVARSFEDAARLSEARLQAILDNCPDSIFVKDLGGVYRFANLSCTALLADDGAGGWVGRTDRDLFGLELAGRFGDQDQAVLGADAPLRWEDEIATVAGPRTFLIVKFPLHDPAGAPYSLCGIATDITERKAAEEELRQARDVAEAASKSKDQFLAMLSHELRTPLTPVLLAVSALLDEEDAFPPEVGSTLQMARRNIELEARLIDDLLDLMRIHRGKMRLDRRPVDAHSLIRHALAICRAEIDIARLELDLDLAATEPHVEADSTRLQQVIWNLIKNAVKFTPNGGSIAVRTRNRARADGGPDAPPCLVIEVSDTGVGIDPEVLPRIFDPFEQGQATHGPRAAGLGLGLAISRSVAEAHGGRLTASSRGEGLGTSFHLELATIPRGPRTPAAREATPAPVRPLKLLLVEDDPDTLRVMARLLGRRGHSVAEAGDIQTALRAAALVPFDVVISDLGLPDGSGLELMRLLGRGRSPLIGIALSGFGSDLDIRLSREAGFAEHLTKPIDFPRLEAILHRLVAGRPEPLALQGPAAG